MVRSHWEFTRIDLPSRNRSSLNPASIPVAFAWRYRTHVRETVRMNTIASNTIVSIISIAWICQDDFASETIEFKAYLPLNKELSWRHKHLMQKPNTYDGLNEPPSSQFPTSSTPGMSSTSLCITLSVIYPYKSYMWVSMDSTVNRDGFLIIDSPNRTKKSKPNDRSIYLFCPQIA